MIRLAMLSLTLVVGSLSFCGIASADECPAYLNRDLQKLHSKETVNVCKAYAGKPLLIVNTASHCGFTPQFKGLQALFEKYQNQGLVVIGFASNDFHQEAKDEAEAAEVCYINYGVKFTMISESSVKGDTANPIFKELAHQTQEPKWNFNKYVVQPNGKVLAYFGSTTSPDSAPMTKAIEEAIAAAK